MEKAVTKTVEVVDELYWFFVLAPADLGFKSPSLAPSGGARQLDTVATGLGEEIGGWYSMPVPTRRQMAASSRERRVRETLAKLSPRHRAVLEVAYSQRNRGHLDYSGVSDLRQNLERELARHAESQFAQAVRAAEVAVHAAGLTGTAEELSEARRTLSALRKEAAGAAEAARELLSEAHAAYIATRGPRPKGKAAEAGAWLAEEVGRGRGLKPTGKGE